MLSRRRILQILGGGMCAALADATIPVALAAAATDRRLVVVLLRGALDGLAAVPPYADPDYRASRGPLALAEPGAAGGMLDLDGRFALHPALKPLHEIYRGGELIVFHAAASPYRGRSHFDGQDALENGTPSAGGARDGWLNRALALMGTSAGPRALAVGQNVPLILRGAAPVGSWTAARPLPEASEDFLARLLDLYRDDPVLGPALEEGLRTQAMSDRVLGTPMMKDGDGRRQGSDSRGRGRGSGSRGRSSEGQGRRRRRGRDGLGAAASGVGKLLAAAGGPRIAVIEAGGWDTHAGQGAKDGRLARNLAGLGSGIARLKESLGPEWRRTAVLVITEFGRTVAVNGTAGTDHGTAGIAFLAGGAVNGGRVVADWPGLAPARLFQGRDLAPTLDLRAVFKAVLQDHLGIAANSVTRTVFPESGDSPALRDLIRI